MQVFPVRKVIGSFSSEDSTIGFRLPELPPGTNTTLGLVTDGILQFDEGSLRGVAAMIVLIAFTLVMGDVEGAALLHPNVTKCVKSLMTIPCKRKTDGNTDKTAIAVQCIVKQNLAASVQPIITFGWSSILKSILGDSVEAANVDAMVDLYNNHPHVAGAGDAVGALEFDAKKLGLETTPSSVVKVHSTKSLKASTTTPTAWDLFQNMLPATARGSSLGL